MAMKEKDKCSLKQLGIINKILQCNVLKCFNHSIKDLIQNLADFVFDYLSFYFVFWSSEVHAEMLLVTIFSKNIWTLMAANGQTVELEP